MAQSKPQFRTVDVVLDAPYDGWTATMRADGIAARIFMDLQSGKVEQQMSATERLVISHNFLTDTGDPAASILDAPMDALGSLLSKWSEAVAALPPR